MVSPPPRRGLPWGGAAYPGEGALLRAPLCAQVFGRSQSLPGADSLLAKPIDKQHTDTVVNFLIRVACQVSYLPVVGQGSFGRKAAGRRQWL